MEKSIIVDENEQNCYAFVAFKIKLLLKSVYIRYPVLCCNLLSIQNCTLMLLDLETP